MLMFFSSLFSPLPLPALPLLFFPFQLTPMTTSQVKLVTLPIQINTEHYWGRRQLFFPWRLCRQPCKTKKHLPTASCCLSGYVDLPAQPSPGNPETRFFFASRLFFFIPHRDRFPRLGGIRRNWFLSAQIQNSVQRLCFEKLVLFTLLTWAGKDNIEQMHKKRLRYFKLCKLNNSYNN